MVVYDWLVAITFAKVVPFQCSFSLPGAAGGLVLLFRLVFVMMMARSSCDAQRLSMDLTTGL